jgi:CheY-like chemotaxis protein
LKVLVLEDNLFFVTRLESALKATGHETRLASSGREAEEALRSGAQAAVVSLHAPGALEFVRLANRTGTPVAAYCGHAEVELRQKAKEAGAGVLLANSDIPSALEKALTHLVRPCEGAAGEPS